MLCEYSCEINILDEIDLMVLYCIIFFDGVFMVEVFMLVLNYVFIIDNMGI